MKRKLLPILVALACFQQPGDAMVFRPATGAIWDPSVIYHDGTYYAFMMYDKSGRAGLNAGHCLLATSKDGVNFARINGYRDSVILDSDPKYEAGHGHTGYFRWRPNPL